MFQAGFADYLSVIAPGCKPGPGAISGTKILI